MIAYILKHLPPLIPRSVEEEEMLIMAGVCEPPRAEQKLGLEEEKGGLPDSSQTRKRYTHLTGAVEYSD